MESSSTDQADKLKEELLKKLTSIIQGSTSDEIIRMITQQQISLGVNDVNRGLTEDSDSNILEEYSGASTSNYENQTADIQKDGKNTFDHLTVFPSRPGATDKGREYEIKMTALMALSCATSNDTEDMWLGSNVHEVGDFDDVVICRRTSKGTVVYLIQLKHQDVPKNITQRDFTYTAQNKKGNRNKHLEDFALSKYYKGFVELKQKLDNQTQDEPQIFQSMRSGDVIFVLFTNRNINECEFLENIGTDDFDFLNTNERKNVRKFNHRKLTDYDSNFLKQLVIFANQAHVSSVDKEIKKELKQILGSSKVNDEELQSATDKFVTFVKLWMNTVLTDKKSNSKLCYILTKRDVINKITDILVDPYKINFAKDTFETYGESAWNEIVHTKSMTLIDSEPTVLRFLKGYFSYEVRKYCGKCKKNWGDSLSKQAQESFYKDEFNTKIFKIDDAKSELTSFHIYHYLWFNQQLPLLLQVRTSQEYDKITAILKLSQFKLRAIIVKDDDLKLKIKDCFATLNDLDKAERDKILDLNVHWQGRARIQLSTVVNESALKHLKCRDIIHILLDDFNVGTKYESLINYFVPRKFYKNLLRFDVLTNNEVYLIKDEAAPESLEYKLKSYNLLDRLNSSIFIVDELNPQLKKFKSNKPTHFLLFNSNGQLEWKQSSGNTRNLTKHRFERREDFYEFCIDQPERLSKVRLISGGPGMGKTILMDLIALGVSTNVWVLKIILDEHNDYYESMKVTAERRSALVHLKYFNEAILKKYGCSNENLARITFQKKLTERNVLVLMDGFDEISILYKDEVTEIANCLYKDGFCVWLTTRPHMAAHLEDTLDTLSLSFKPFTVDDQRIFLFKYFTKLALCSNVNDAISYKEHFILYQLITRDFIDILLKAARNNLADGDLHFTGIPLQTKLLADVFSKEFVNSLSRGTVALDGKFDLLYLYEEFMKKKAEILYQKYGHYAKEMQIFFDDHQKLLALQILFDKRDLFRLQIDEQLKEYYKDKRDKVNILQREGLIVLEHRNVNSFRVKFVHRTFAEFLAAQWLTENYNSEDYKVRTTVEILMSNRFLINEETDYTFLFTMFDCILSKGLALHNAVINGQLSEAKRLINENPGSVEVTDQGRRTVLHMVGLNGIAVVRNPVEIAEISDLIDEIPLGGAITERDSFGFNPLDYALMNRALATADKLCQKWEHLFVTVLIEEINDFIRSCNTYKFKALFKKLFRYIVCFKLLANAVTEDKLLVDCLPRFYNEHLDNIPDYLDEFNVTTVTELLSNLSIKDGQYYSDLYFAVAFGTVENVGHALSKGVDANERLFGNTPLHYAIEHERKQIPELLLSVNVDVNKSNTKGNTALHFACKTGNIAVVRSLLLTNAAVNELNKTGETPVLLAIQNNHQMVAFLLLSVNANGEGEDKYGNTCLHWAARTGQYFAVQNLIYKRLDINKRNRDGETPLYLALQRGHPDIARLLLTHDADAENETSYRNSCLHYAARSGHEDIVLALIHKGLDVDQRNKFNETPLFYALSENRNAIVNLLISFGADIKNEDDFGNSSLHLAKDYDFVKRCIEEGLDVNKQNKKHETPLIIALQKKRIQIAELLLRNGADIEIKIEGNSTFHRTAKSGCLESWVNLLNETNTPHNSNINLRNDENQTPLHFSLFKYYFETAQDIQGQTETVEFLLNNGADVNVQDDYGNTVLHYVSNYNYYHSRPAKTDMDKCYENMATLLLDHNVDVNLKNKSGKSALDLAIECNHPNIVVLIKQKLENPKNT